MTDEILDIWEQINDAARAISNAQIAFVESSLKEQTSDKKSDAELLRQSLYFADDTITKCQATISRIYAFHINAIVHDRMCRPKVVTDDD